MHHMEKASIALFLSVKLLPHTVRGLSYARKFANFRISPGIPAGDAMRA